MAKGAYPKIKITDDLKKELNFCLQG